MHWPIIPVVNRPGDNSKIRSGTGIRQNEYRAGPSVVVAYPSLAGYAEIKPLSFKVVPKTFGPITDAVTSAYSGGATDQNLSQPAWVGIRQDGR